MGLIEGESPIPETYAGPAGAWWSPQKTGGVTILDRDVRGDEMLELTGLNTTASKRPMRPEGSHGQVIDQPSKNWVGVYRDGDDVELGMVTPSYHLFQFSEMVEMTDKVLELPGGPHYHTGGTLYGGRLGWVLARFDQTIHVKGDGSPFESYLFAITGHDGRHALQFAATDVRVWCGNTADAALKGSNNKVSLRHTSGMADRTAEVQRALTLVVKHKQVLEAHLNDLADRPMTIDAFRAFTEVLIPNDPTKDERQPRRQAKRDELAALFANSRTMEGLPFTAYRALQAVTEWTDQTVVYKDTPRMDATTRAALAVYEGTAYDLKTRASALLVKA